MSDLPEEICYANSIINLFFHSSNSFISQHFLYSIDNNDQNYEDYSQIISEPICLTEIKSKVDQNIYADIREFICDFRLLFFNCYRYYGVDSKLGKACSKLEGVFEQKLVLLPTHIRQKTTMESILMDEDKDILTTGGITRRRCSDRLSNNDIRLATPIKAMFDEIEKFGSVSSLLFDNPSISSDPTNYLLKQLQRWQEKRKKTQIIRNFDSWFIENTDDTDRNILKSSYEFIELVQLLQLMYAAVGLDQLLESALGIDDVSYEDLEYALLFPRSSQILSGIVALSSTTNKLRMVKIKAGLPNYNEWNDMLIEKLRLIYRTWSYTSEVCNKEHEMIRRWNLDERIFKVLGHTRSPMDKRQFHEINIWQRCTVLLAMFLVTIRQQDSVRSAMDKSIDDWDAERIIRLGQIEEDSEYEYVRFPVLGKLAGFYVYKMRILRMDPSLGDYQVEYIEVKDHKSKPPKKSRKSQVDPKFRQPAWFVEENSRKKSKPKSSKQPKKPSKPVKTPTITRTSSRYKLRSKIESDDNVTASDDVTGTESKTEESTTKEPIDVAMNEIKLESTAKENDIECKNDETPQELLLIKVENKDVEIKNENDERPGETKLESKDVEDNKSEVVSDKIEPSPSSKDNNEDDNDNEEDNNLDDNFDGCTGNSESELEPPEMTRPPEDEIELVARDLKSITDLETNINNLTDPSNSLLSEITAIRIYWENMESQRVEVVNKARIRLRTELEEEHKQETVRQRKILQKLIQQKEEKIVEEVSKEAEEVTNDSKPAIQDETVEDNKDEDVTMDDEEPDEKVCQSVSSRPQRRVNSLRKSYNYDKMYYDDEDEDDEVEEKYKEDYDDEDYMGDDDFENNEAGIRQNQESRSERYARRLRGDINPRSTVTRERSNTNLGRRVSTRKRRIKQDYEELSFTQFKIKHQRNAPQICQKEENGPKKKVMKVVNYEGDEDNGTEEHTIQINTNGIIKEAHSNSQSEASSIPQTSTHNTTSSSNVLSLSARPNRPKQRIFKCRETYFTGNLEPVHVKTDGTLTYLDPTTIHKDDFVIARKMISIYFRRQAELGVTTSKKDDNPNNSIDDQDKNGVCNPANQNPDETNSSNHNSSNNSEATNEKEDSSSHPETTVNCNGTDNNNDVEIPKTVDSGIPNHSTTTSPSDSVNKNKEDELNEMSFNSCSTIPFCGESQINILYSNGQNE